MVFCSSKSCFLFLVSGEAPNHPVISVKTGHIYEKSLLTRYLSDHGTDPVTNGEAQLEDYIDVLSRETY